MDTDLAGAPNLVGLVIQLDRGCARCGNSTLVIASPGAGPHAASLACTRCHRNGGWLQKEAAAFVAEVVKKFGRPDQPIVIRQSPYRAGLANGDEEAREEMK